LAGLGKLHGLHLPFLIGASRKSFVRAIVAGEGLDVPQAQTALAHQLPNAAKRSPQSVRRESHPEDSATLATGDAALVTAAILAGAHIVRVHDPASILPAVRVADAVLAACNHPRR
jgi:dihydropteroate synthase